ncbi:MAG: sigma-70 family RNA polymerase sigma factor [Cyanobium sp. Prado107]|jgi:RNA polymerase sigma-B factor|nr:sigma-70 family RNA polymerase sigma factor [Cyanobium sp. Prado107]
MSTALSTGFAPPARSCRAARPRRIARRNERIEHYRQLVRPIALHYHQRCAEPLDDLTQVGLLGLLRAAELYRPGSGTPFPAFARPHVRGAILHYLRDLAAPVRLSRRVEERRHQLSRLRRDWLARHGSQPSAQQLRTALGLSPRQWQELEATVVLQRPLSLQEVLTEEGLCDLASPADGEGETDERGGEVLGLLSQLEEPLRTVVERVVLTGWSYRRTAEVLQVSPMTVQRRLRRGLEKLRGLLSCPAAAPGRAASAAPAC